MLYDYGFYTFMIGFALFCSKPFICIVSGKETGQNRFWIFGTEEGVKRFAASKETFADGCYKWLTDDYQVYTVLGKFCSYY